MNLQEFMDAVDCRVCGGSTFQWACYPNARYMDISDINGNEVGSCLFSTVSQEVYEIEFYVYDDNVAYRWTDLVYAQARNEESASKGLDPAIAYDDVRFSNVESEEEILKLVRSIVHMTYVHSHPLVEEQA